ncbi:MAG TPA: hypothetical protein VFR05_03910 [Terriglobia bacterium]|nr:hypothetical protein [Terriglobia bacterium]
MFRSAVKTRLVLPITSWLALGWSFAVAQEPIQNPAPAAPLMQTLPGLPEGNAVWVVRVTRTGGYAGVWREITLNSERKLTCTSCADQSSRTVPAEIIQSVTPSFNFGDSIVPEDAVASVMCMDCMTTRILVQRRNMEGSIESYSASWNEVTTARVPSEFVKLARAILSFETK